MRSEYYSTYFVVPKKDGGLRPILNLKYFNLSVWKTSFKMETLLSIIAVMRPQQWMASVDLKDTYFYVPVVAAHHQFLRFSWLGMSYQFRIPFGLSSAPQVFTKTLAPLIAWLRLLRVQLYAYLNDLLVMGESKEEVAQSVQKTIQFLVQAEFVVNL